MADQLDAGKKVSRAFILLSFHPDKLPVNIKEEISKDQASGDNASSLFSSRVFDAVKTKGEALTIASLKTILNDTKHSGGGKSKRIAKRAKK